ncbi:MAG: hypothetical protein F2667_14205 [Actinobacteria bacterium]|uniref:Unannotated protein n=1 Tax=freshwater metagenome TaxID=449393 RepID=A0A6J6SF41_9ZZZZ|nr:hypothetical protein [Actinomycetota bacterium]
MKGRLEKLRALRERLDEEIAAEEHLQQQAAAAQARAEAEAAFAGKVRDALEAEETARLGEVPPCGTERAYQRHRYVGELPLPQGDPCGCQEAHRVHSREEHVRRVARQVLEDLGVTA